MDTIYFGEYYCVEFPGDVEEAMVGLIPYADTVEYVPLIFTDDDINRDTLDCVSTDDLMDSTWHFDGLFGINASEATDYACEAIVMNGKNVRVAVIDADYGVTGKIHYEFDFTDNIVSHIFFDSVAAWEGIIHGTSVLGPFVASLGNGALENRHQEYKISLSSTTGRGLTGIGYFVGEVHIYDYNDGAGSVFANFVRDVESAVSLKVDVINFSVATYVENSKLRQLLEIAYINGTSIFASAGNCSMFVPCPHIQWPAAWEQIVFAVTGHDKEGNVSGNSGDFVDASAPAKDIFTTGQEKDKLPTGDTREDLMAFSRSDGTSFSAPITAGVAALLYAMKPDISAASVYDILRSTAFSFEEEWTPYRGDGNIDALAAVMAVNNSYEPCCGTYTGGYPGNTNGGVGGLRDLADITKLIDNVYITKAPLDCPENGNVNGDLAGLVNLADITKLIDHVYISKAEVEFCL